MEQKRFFRNLAIIMIIIVFAIALYFTLRSENCVSYGCFQGFMIECSPANYVNEEPDATWFYEIKGENGDRCEVEVTMLLAKKGELGIDKLEGQSMTCSYPLGVSAYPEKNLNACHGLLKEGLQEIVIEKIHGYVLNNLEEINLALEGS